MSSTISSFLTGLIIVLILHYSIKHYLLYLQSNKNSTKRVRFNLNPTIRYIKNNKQSRKNNNLFDISKKTVKTVESENTSEEIANKTDLKSELLNYVKTYNPSSNNKELEVLLEQENNYSETKLNNNSEDNLSSFFQINNNDTYQFVEAPTCQDDQILDELPTKIDSFSKEPIFTEENGSENTLSKDRWKYANEKVMNGGKDINNIHAYDNFNMSDNFAQFDAS